MLFDQVKGFFFLGKFIIVSWKLLVLSGGYLISVFGEWNGVMFFFLIVIVEGRVVVLQEYLIFDIFFFLQMWEFDLGKLDMDKGNWFSYKVL